MPRGPRKYMCQNQKEAHVAFLFSFDINLPCLCKINLTGSIYPVWLEIKTQLKTSVQSNRIKPCLFPLETEHVIYWIPAMWAALCFVPGSVKEYKDDSGLHPTIKITLFRGRQYLDKTEGKSHALWRTLWKTPTAIVNPEVLFLLGKTGWEH